MGIHRGWIYKMKSVICLSPTLFVTLPLSLSKQPRSWEKHSYTCGWGKEKKKKKTQSQLHKREYAWIWDMAGARRCKWSRGSKQQSNIENKRTKGKTESAVCEQEKYSQLEKHPSLLQITAVGKLCYQPSWSGRFHVLKQQDYLAKVGFLKSQ